MNNTVLNDQNLNVNFLISPSPSPPSLAEELYQKVKRLFGDPHQATEDLKAEVIITPNLSSFVFDVPKLMTLTLMLPHLLPKIKEKLSDHEAKLQEAQDLLYSAQGKTRQAGSLAEQNKANLTALEVEMHTNLWSHTH